MSSGPSGPAEIVVDDAAMQAQVDRMWQAIAGAQPDLERPDVKFGPLVERAEQPRLIENCLHDGGFPGATANRDGTIESGDVPSEQMSQYWIALYECSVLHPIDPKYLAPFDVGQLEVLYAYYVREMTDCVQSLGYKSSDPPSLEVFIDGYDDGRFWSPFADAASAAASEEDFYLLADMCPEFPESVYEIDS